jgi:guanosine-3',5'-bis(diphosphate) 3'-pyrophosphohydrolase
MLSPVPDAAVLLDAIHFAAAKHRDQRREDASASPFVNHPIETASILANVGRMRVTTILASAILHDILEDTRTTPREIEDRFGREVKCLVEEVTDDPGMPTDARRQHQLARLAHASPAAKQIRLADKIANLRSLPVHWSRTDGERYIAFAEQVAGSVRGINTHLDALFLETVLRARTRLRKTRRTVPPSPAPTIPRPPAIAADTIGATDPELRLLQRLHSKAEEMLDRILMGRGRGAGAVPARAPRGLNAEGHAEHGRRPRRFAGPSLKRLAGPGIGSIEFRAIDARYVEVSIDGAKAFRLPIGQARLLKAMAFAEGDRSDGFAPFQSRREVAAQLAKLTGRPPGDHTMVVAIGRLRLRLQTVGLVNPLLVETEGQNVRLRLRRPKP